MSTTPREPLLSDDILVSMVCVTGDGKRQSERVRDFYEDLITTGKLRVVEEVELDESSYCLRCGYSVTDRYEEVPPYCHDCGNKIKR